MTDNRIVFVDTKPRGKPVDLGGEVAAYSFMPHNRPDRPLYGSGWSAHEAVVNVARQGFPLRVVLVGGEVIEVRRRDG